MGEAIAVASEKDCLAWLSSQYKELVENETSFSQGTGRVEKTDTVSILQLLGEDGGKERSEQSIRKCAWTDVERGGDQIPTWMMHVTYGIL